ncbi:MAG: CapA family protein [Spirochaetales bacterium]|nr:MAG: CapA family protein [Spirochaetales bacterium]
MAMVVVTVVAACAYPSSDSASAAIPYPKAETAKAGLPASEPVSERTLTLLACGDILLARTPGKRVSERGFRFLFQGVRDLVSDADIAFANLETPVSYLGEPYPGKPVNVTFRADPATLFGLAWAGFDVVSLANNHMNDYGPAALAETLEYLDLLGVARAGAGLDLEEAGRPALIERNGELVAILAYAEPMWSAVEAKSARFAVVATRAETRLSATGQRPGDGSTGDVDRAGIAPALIPAMVADVRRVRETLDPDYLFVSVHWGDEHQHIPRAFQRNFGRAAIDAGAIAVLGHHPHVLQSVERYRDGLILHSMGNFVFDMAADHTYETAAFRVILAGGRIRRLEVVPIRITRGLYTPVPARGTDAEGILRDLAARSAYVGTRLEVEEYLGILDF